MPFSKKRKISETSEDALNETATATPSADDSRTEENTTSTEAPEKDSLSDKNETVNSDTAVKDQEARRERFRALQVRAVSTIFTMKYSCLETSALASSKRSWFANTDRTCRRNPHSEI